MIKLYLENKPHRDRKVLEAQDIKEVWDYIEKWLNRKNFHSHYYRTWTAGSKNYIDFGDWHVFFYYKIV